MSIVFTKLFNLVLETGIIPEDWVIGIIRPIYKNKGNKADPNILLSSKKRLYCAFLDFEKAFDKVDRAFLWQKLFEQKVDGKILKVIKQIYSSAKSCIMVNDEKSDFFQINIGVRQGENLSPILFALFLNDMNKYMSDVMNGLETINQVAHVCWMPEDDLNAFLKLFMLLYADDTAIFADTPEKLQMGLNRMKLYCDRWTLKLNPNKCKIIIFSRGKVRIHPEFKIGEDVIEVVSNFMYLGMKLNYNNKMYVAQKDLFERASRAMFALLKKCKSSNLPIDIIIDLFEKTVVPILTYGCEVWGFGTNEIVNKLQRKFLKIVLRLKMSTPTAMIHGETGTYPIDVTIKCRIMNFWYSLVAPENMNKLSSRVYNCLLTMYKLRLHESPYVKLIHNTLIEVGLPYLWDTHDVTQLCRRTFKSHIKQHIHDLYIHEWQNNLANSSMYLNYNIFKTHFAQEPYLSILPYNCAITMIRFRTTNNALPVNSLRAFDIDRDLRLCHKCNSDNEANEFHYLFVCEHFKNKREQCLDRKYYIRPDHRKYSILFNSKNKTELLRLKHFIDYINKNV